MFAVPPLPTIVPLAFGGRPALQLAGLNQLPVALFQLVCARADVAASNVAAATTVVANKCVRISPPKKLLHNRLISLLRYSRLERSSAISYGPEVC